MKNIHTRIYEQQQAHLNFSYSNRKKKSAKIYIQCKMIKYLVILILCLPLKMI